MMCAGVVLVLSTLSVLIPGVPLPTVVAMGLAGAIGLLAARLHAVADTLRLGGAATAAPTLRAARRCDDAAFALALLAVLYAVAPL
jgi:hypothetical protein